MLTRRRRTIVVAVAVAAIVVAANANDGAYFSQSWGWVALAFLIPTAVLLLLDRVEVPGRFRIALASFMGALAAWVALSALWSVSTSASIREVERMLVYLAVALAIALVLRRGDGPGVIAGTLTGVTVVSTYALATRLFLDRFEVVDDPVNASRLAEPIGYWNALGLLATVGATLAIGVVAHARRTRFAIAAGASVPLLVTTLYFTFSRGSWLALGFGLVSALALDPRRVSLLWTVIALAPATVVALVFASRQEALIANDLVTEAAVREGHRLAVALALLILFSAVLAGLAHRLGQRVRVPAKGRRLVAVALAAGAAVIFIAALTAAGGPASAITHLRDRFDADLTGAESLNDRLFSVSGTGRAETIRVAWTGGMEHVVAGTGAGTFEQLWYEHRPSTQIVRDAHSLYVETFNELGVVGLALLAVALLIPVAAAVRGRRSRYVAPTLGAYLAWVAASGLDWHWEMVGVTTTALVLGSAGLLASERGPRGNLQPGSRLALIGVSGTLSVLAVWSLVGNQALFAGRDAVGRKDWSAARHHARRAHALLPWSVEPEIVLGDAAAGLGDREGALRAFRDAVATDPRNWVAWLRLAQVARGAERAAAYDRVRELNPLEEGLPGE